MNMDQAAVFLAGSILTALGFVVVIVAVVAANNVISKYWKPVRIFTSDSWNLNPPSYMLNEEYKKSQEPTMEKKDTK